MVKGELAIQDRSLDEFIKECAHAFGVEVQDLLDKDKRKPYVLYRMASMAAARKLMKNASFPSIGRAFQRDHSTVIHAVKKAKQKGELKELTDKLVSYIRRERSGS